MNTETGQLKELKELTEKEKKSGKWIEVPEPQLGAVRGMNRKQRRRWAAEQRAKKL